MIREGSFVRIKVNAEQIQDSVTVHNATDRLGWNEVMNRTLSSIGQVTRVCYSPNYGKYYRVKTIYNYGSLMGAPTVSDWIAWYCHEIPLRISIDTFSYYPKCLTEVR